MKFEERVTVLCAQALASEDDAEVRTILSELRLILHQHIEQLRSGVVARAKSIIGRECYEDTNLQPACMQLEEAGPSQGAHQLPLGRWEQIVHQIAHETDHKRALQLSQELSRILRRHPRPPAQC